jgi:hypothetical protein
MSTVNPSLKRLLILITMSDLPCRGKALSRHNFVFQVDLLFLTNRCNSLWEFPRTLEVTSPHVPTWDRCDFGTSMQPRSAPHG